MPDLRDPRGLCHQLAAVLAVGIAAVVAGACSSAAIGVLAADAGEQVLAQLGITVRAPEEATLCRLFALIDAEVLDRLLGAWMWVATTVVAGGC